GVRRDGGESTSCRLGEGLLSLGHDVGPEEDQRAARERECVERIAQQEEREDRGHHDFEKNEERGDRGRNGPHARNVEHERNECRYETQVEDPNPTCRTSSP